MQVENDSHFHLDGPSGRQRLSAVPLNRPFLIELLDGPAEDCDRLMDLGFTPGEEVIVSQQAPLGDPLIVRIRGAMLALRRREAGWIWVR